ncbi:MAG: ABC transporter permease [Archangium sp.]
MKNVLLIARRELQAYLRTMSGYIIIAVILFLVGLAFNGIAVQGTAKKSSEVLADFFTWTSGLTMVCAVFLSMRLISEERQTGTIALLYSSPVHDVEIVLGKFVASFAFLCLFLASTLYMPALVAIYGKVSVGHILTGYFGLMLVGASSLAIGTFGSSLTRSQVVAAVLSGVMCVALTIAWMLGKVTDRPLTDIVVGLAWWGHFDAFRTGLIHLKHVSYFVLVTFLSLFAATRVLEARRWR